MRNHRPRHYVASRSVAATVGTGMRRGLGGELDGWQRWLLGAVAGRRAGRVRRRRGRRRRQRRHRPRGHRTARPGSTTDGATDDTTDDTDDVRRAPRCRRRRSPRAAASSPRPSRRSASRSAATLDEVDGDAVEDFEEVIDDAPEEIRGDLEIFADAFAEYAEAARGGRRRPLRPVEHRPGGRQASRLGRGVQQPEVSGEQRSRVRRRRLRRRSSSSVSSGRPGSAAGRAPSRPRSPGPPSPRRGAPPRRPCPPAPGRPTAGGRRQLVAEVRRHLAGEELVAAQRRLGAGEVAAHEQVGAEPAGLVEQALDLGPGHLRRADADPADAVRGPDPLLERAALVGRDRQDVAEVVEHRARSRRRPRRWPAPRSRRRASGP